MHYIHKEKAIKAILAAALIAAIALPLCNIFFIYPSFKRQLVQNIEDDAVRVAAHLSSTLVHETGELKKENLPHDLINMTEAIKRDFKLWKLKIFSESGEIIYSTDPKDIGNVNKHKYFHEIVAKGNPYSVMTKKNSVTLEGQMVNADVVETYVPIMRDGGFIGAFEIYYDVTARKQRLDKLTRHYSGILYLIAAISFVSGLFLFKANKDIIIAKENAEKNKLFLDTILMSSVNIAIAATDTDFRIIYFNPIAENITGYRAEDVVGKTVVETLIKEKVESERFEKAIENVKNIGEHKYIVEQKRGGDTHYISARVSGIYGAKGNLIGYLWMAQDITEITAAERQLKNSYEELAKKTRELERFHELTVDREMQMIKLKEEVNALLKRLGEPVKYEMPENT